MARIDDLRAKSIDDLTTDERIELIGLINAENEALKADKAKRSSGERTTTPTSVDGISLKVSQKGAVSVYGLGRWPITLYKEQWPRLLGAAKDIEQFIADNQDRLASKEDKKAEQSA